MVQFLSTGQAGRLCGVSPVTVAKWIDEGMLRGHTTPGGHRRVAVTDLATFLKRHYMAVPPQLQTYAIRRLLAADPDETVHEALRSAAETFAPKLEYCGVLSGTQALVRLGSWRPHLVLLGLGLQDVDPLAVCRWLSHVPESAGSVVTVVTTELDERVEMGLDSKITVVFAPRSRILEGPGAFLKEVVRMVDDELVEGPGNVRSSILGRPARPPR